MRYLDLTLSTPAENLALDEALLLEGESKGHEILRLWHWPTPVVVLGAGCRLADDVDEAACQLDSIPILRRGSGGGTILWGQGCLLYTLVLRYDRHPFLVEIRSSYQWILEQVMSAIALPELSQEGISDLTFCGRKFSGNAQQRKANALLHHGTLLHSFDLSLIGRYLRQPPRQPDYRHQRSHEDFVVNLPRSINQLKQALQQQWQAEDQGNAIPLERIANLCAERYLQSDWHRRR